ncbi:MAG: hypothetical protein IPP71_00875 [Bacteroidetes bacterium]|nr:hypothetical protein [Bacteroidota bacterium]
MSLMNSKSFIKIILLFYSFLFLYACTGSKTTTSQNNDFPGDASDSLIASVERTRCYGVCPNYKILFYRSGYVIYEGYDHVTKIGRYYTFINKDQLSSIGIKAEETGYFNLNDSYKNPHLTDFPTIYSEVRFRGKVKKITRYDAEPPANLVEMENYLDKVIPEDQLWIKHPIQDLKE